MVFFVFTIGCKVNHAESSGLIELLCSHGFQNASSPAKASLLIVNSCAVTAESVRKTRQLLRGLRRKYPDRKIVLTGCWPQAFPQDNFEEADFVTGTKNRDALLGWIEKTIPQKQCIEPYRAEDAFSALPCADTTRTRAFLKIQDGCDQFCSYCIIPFARGRSRSMPAERLALEVNTLAKRGFLEIVLTGINLGFFGCDIGMTLADAVEICAAEPSVQRVRLGSLEPERMTPELLAALSSCEKFCPHFHLSLQSGSDAVLAQMRRRYTTADYRELANEIRRLFPKAALTTDVIVGFPGETDADFSETLSFVKEMEFAKVHCFPFSPRKGTKAADFPNQIPPKLRAARAAELRRLAEELQKRHLAKQVGKTLPVLVEGVHDASPPAPAFCQGHAPDGTLVKIFLKSPKKDLQNSIICAKIESYAENCCISHLS